MDSDEEIMREFMRKKEVIRKKYESDKEEKEVKQVVTVTDQAQIEKDTALFLHNMFGHFKTQSILQSN